MVAKLPLEIKHSPFPVIVPKKGCLWADKMVLNPAIIKDLSSSRIYMLFRATGSYPWKQYKDKPLPYPIFLGYAFSDDDGKSWKPDFSQPALAPPLNDTLKDLYISNIYGNKVINYANGGLEDPRLFFLDDELYLTIAARLFPGGPYWKGDYRQTFLPEWAKSPDNILGRAAAENLTVSVLYKVNLEHLRNRDYKKSFEYITHLTDPELGENRDVYLFPEKMRINDKMQYVCVHRPETPGNYGSVEKEAPPSIFLSATDRSTEFPSQKAKHQLLIKPIFDWETERVGGSWPPIKISGNEWLFSYHGKKDNKAGYTQSFMILEKDNDSFPKVTHRCSERFMYAKQDWQLQGDFKTPCLFSTSGIVINDTLMVSYGAADERIGIAWMNFHELISYIRSFDHGSKRIE